MCSRCFFYCFFLLNFQQTKVGVSVGLLRRCASEKVSTKALELVNKWRPLAKKKCDKKENNGEKIEETNVKSENEKKEKKEKSGKEQEKHEEQKETNRSPKSEKRERMDDDVAPNKRHKSIELPSISMPNTQNIYVDQTKKRQFIQLLTKKLSPKKSDDVANPEQVAELILNCDYSFPFLIPHQQKQI
jgi:hypothetical protein